MPTKSKRFAPARVASTRDLADLQRAMWRVVSRPLTCDSRMQRRWTDGRPTSAVAGEIAKPNDRLTSFERLEIYNRMYWFRVLDSLFDDCPGLRAVLGDKKFIALLTKTRPLNAIPAALQVWPPKPSAVETKMQRM